MPSILSTNSSWITTIGLSTAAAIAAGAGYYCYYSYRQKLLQTPPELWNYVGKLKDITIYPIKSCGGIDLDIGKCTEIGLMHEVFNDRGFALLDDNGKVITARTYPKMLKIKPKIFKNWITLSAPNMNDLEIHLDTIEKNDMKKANVCDCEVLVSKCGPTYDKWFSKFILDKNDGVTLVYYKFPEATKPIISELKTESFLQTDTGSLHDASSYLLLNQESINDLNTRLNDKVHCKQFRPNFTIQTDGPAYDEDNWNWIKIGDDVIFRVVVPSYRCIFTNINHITAERSPDFEPLKTLKSYRVWGKLKSPRMGVQLGIRKTGYVKKGDDVYVG